MESSQKVYNVFVSHAGEDKETIAIPLRTMLRKKGIAAFVDEKDISPGGTATDEMTVALDDADVAVIVLSPEFVAKKWPMRELLFFLYNRKAALAKKETSPVIIPVFYRLSVADMYIEPLLHRKMADGKSLYRATRFYERMDDGEPEADVETIQRALRALHGIMGVENKYKASNNNSSAPSRLLLLKDVCEIVSRAIAQQVGGKTENEGHGSVCPAITSLDKFRSYFHSECMGDVVLEFDGVHTQGKPITHEGRIKHWILTDGEKTDRTVAILGGGGVGKSTILKGLANEKDVRKRFCDGVHFISLGMNATVSKLLRELCQVLGNSGALKMKDTLQAESDVNVAIENAIRDAKSWFRGKRCCFLIDDVWTNKIDIDLFAQLFQLGRANQRSTVVFTTREHEVASVASLAGIFRVTTRAVQGTESKRILFSHVGIQPDDWKDPSAKQASQEVLEICDGLPVSLATAGKGIKMLMIDAGTHSGDAWKQYRFRLRKHREQLLRGNVGDYGQLYGTFRASIALLEGRKEEKLGFKAPLSFAEMHCRLCLLEKQARAPPSKLRQLWKLQSDEEAKVVGMRFVEVGLAESEYELVGYDKRVWHLRIHDSLLDFAVTEAAHNRLLWQMSITSKSP